MTAALSRLVCLILSVCLLPAVCSAADGGRAVGDGYRVVNLMPAFWAFWEKAEKAASPEKVRLFRQMVQEPNASVFAAAAPSASRDDFLAAYLENLPRFIPAMRALSDRLTAELPTYRASFQQAFPDMAWTGDVYFLPSCFTFDGAVRQVDGKPVLVFGVDMIAALHGPQGNVAPLFHHELFHVYHRGVASEVFSGDFAGKLWTEGLAVFASQRLNPAATMAEVLLPPDLIRRTDADLPRLVREVRDKLDSRDFTTFRDYYDGGSKRPDVPARAGYYIGLLVVRDVATRLSLAEMARLKGADLRREIRTALRHLDGVPLSVAECREDIAAVFAAIEMLPGRDNGAVARERAALEKSLTNSLNRVQWYARLAPVVARLSGGRASLGYPPQVWVTYRANGGLAFPFEVRVQEGKVFVVRSFLDNPEIGPGAEIRSINGVPARNIAADVVALSGGDRRPAKERAAGDRFAANLYFLYGWPGPYAVEYVPAEGGKVRNRIVDGVDEATVARRQPAGTGTPTAEPLRQRVILLPNSGLPLYLSVPPADK